MGDCKFCGQWAGLFSDHHKECAQADAERQTAFAEKVARVKALIAAAPDRAVSVDELATLIAPIAGDDSVTIWQAFCEWISELSNTDTAPSEKDEKLAAELALKYNLKTQAVPDRAWDRFLRLCVMRDLAGGKFPGVHVAGDIPFNLEAGERIVWVFGNTQYFEDKVQRSSYNYGGLSVRVAPGMYIHGGHAAPHPQTEGFVKADEGILALSDRAVLFHGRLRTIRFAYQDIASFSRYDYGFAICKGAETSRPIGFVTKDVFPGFPNFLLRKLCEFDSGVTTPHQADLSGSL